MESAKNGGSKAPGSGTEAGARPEAPLQERRRLDYLTALGECTREISIQPDAEAAIRVAARWISQVLGLRRALVLVPDADVFRFQAIPGPGFDGNLPEDTIPAERLSLAVACLADGNARTTDGAEEQGLMPASLARRARFHNVVAVPLTTQARPLGLLVGDREPGEAELEAEELELVSMFARQASAWIANVDLLHREQSARGRAEASETRLSNLLDSAPDATVMVDENAQITLVNSQAESLFGYSQPELAGQPVEVLLPLPVRERHVEMRDRYLQEPRLREMGYGRDLWARRKDGELFPVEISLSPCRTAEGLTVVAVIRDITERRKAEAERARLLASERQKAEQLQLSVREAHHRIKNNLQAISDLLYLELISESAPSAAEALRDSMERVQAIAAVHDLLSQDEDVRTVDIRVLLSRLVPMVLRSNGLTTEQVKLTLDAGAYPLSSKRATALALITNELVSNAAKHAFRGGQGAHLWVTVRQQGEELVLQVRDDGPGLPADFHPERSASVGLQVIRLLAERDLAGRFTLTSGDGVTGEVAFVW